MHLICGIYCRNQQKRPVTNFLCLLSMKIKKIAVSEITQRHPDTLYCSTDNEYASLANNLMERFGSQLTFMSEREIRNACISLALYFEDIHSGTHQLDAFTQMYHTMYGNYVPFYEATDATSPHADLDAMKFVLWLSIVAERNGMIVNPMNEGLMNMADALLDYWNHEKQHISPNEELADYIFSEETQEDAFLVRNVLVWLQNRSYLGRWYANPALADDDHYGFGRLMPNLSRIQLRDANEACSVFEYRSWPLSVPASRVYAEMIRIDMDDPADEIAADIEQMGFAGLGIYKILKTDHKYFEVENYRGERLPILNISFSHDMERLAKKNTHILGSFFSYQGEWYSNGYSSVMKLDDRQYEAHCQKEKEKYDMLHNHAGQYDDLIKRNKGQRLFFFNHPEDMKEWMRTEMGIEDTRSFPTSAFTPGKAFMIFINSNGQMTFTDRAECVKSSDNFYYDKEIAEEEGIALCLQTSCSNPDLAFYLIKHNLLPDAMFSDIRGKEHGRVLLQENLDFMARCMRRDIETDEVVRRRPEHSQLKATNEDGNQKVNYETFVNILSQEKSIRSKACKEWRVVKCNKATTVIRDVSKRREFSMPTSSLYQAYTEIDKDNIQVATLAPYVGSTNAPAASALLYNTVGNGKQRNELNKTMKQIIRLLGKKP